MRKILEYLLSKVYAVLVFAISTTTVVALEYFIDQERPASVLEKYCYVSVVVIVFYLVFVGSYKAGVCIYQNLRNLRKRERSTAMFVSLIPKEKITLSIGAIHRFLDSLSQVPYSAVDICLSTNYLIAVYENTFECYKLLDDNIIPQRATDEKMEQKCKESFSKINEHYDVANAVYSIYLLLDFCYSKREIIEEFLLPDDKESPQLEKMLMSMKKAFEDIEWVKNSYYDLVIRIQELQKAEQRC